jgi:hypothetical protein
MDNIIELPKPSDVTQIMIFRMLWHYSDRKSFLSGLWLREYMDTPLFPNCFAHVLPKGMNKYPYFKFYAKNVILLSPGEHALYDQGTEEARISYAIDLEEKSGGKNTARWDKIKALEDELLKEYQKWFPSTRGMMVGCKYSLAEQQIIIGALNQEFFDQLKKK